MWLKDTNQLPRWQSHKVVRAAPIVAVHHMEAASAEIELDLGNGETVTVQAARGMFARYQPVAGDYYVLYEDGYASISPKAAFEGGYTRMKEGEHVVA